MPCNLFGGNTDDHEIGHTLVAASVRDGSPGYISCNPGKAEDGTEYNGICGASASSALSSSMVWVGGIAGEKVFAGVDRDLPEDSEDYIKWQQKSQEAGIDPQQAFQGACALLDTPGNHAAHQELKKALKDNGGELSDSQVKEIINRAYDQFPGEQEVVNPAGITKRKRSLIDRLNDWLYENPGELFKDGKWKFWLMAEIGLQVLIGLATYFLFPIDTAFLVIISSGIILWLIVGFLHYTDSQDGRLNKGLSWLDSIALCFAVLHFSYLLWVFGHYSILKHAEADYEEKRYAWNQEVDRDRDRKLKQTQAEVEREKTREKIARYEADIAYRASLNGQRVRMKTQPQSTELGEEAKQETKSAPKSLTGETSQQYLSSRDSFVRFLHMLEIFMAVARLIYIRIKSASANESFRAQPASQWRERKN